MPPVHPLTLPAATASGIGSLPGTAALEAAALSLQLLPRLAYLPELPARGPGADMIGRAFGVLTELYAALAPSGWRFHEHPGKDSRRAVSHLGEDLDAVEERGQGYAGAFKVSVAGPWTIAASVELRHGDKSLSDPGACRDIAASLADGLRNHVAEVRKRLPDATEIVVQLDEPALPTVLRGGVPTASGFGKLAAIEEHVVESALQQVIREVEVPVVVHCCAPAAPLALLRRAGAAGLALDLSLALDEDSLAEFVEGGGVLFAGVVPSTDRTLPTVGQATDPIRTLWHRIGLPAKTLGTVVPTPTCGMAGASPQHARAATRRCTDVADGLAEAADA
ncbi:MAG: methionine synthase [Sporichthyaceae bacterium]